MPDLPAARPKKPSLLQRIGLAVLAVLLFGLGIVMYLPAIELEDDDGPLWRIFAWVLAFLGLIPLVAALVVWDHARGAGSRGRSKSGGDPGDEDWPDFDLD